MFVENRIHEYLKRLALQNFFCHIFSCEIFETPGLGSTLNNYLIFGSRCRGLYFVSDILWWPHCGPFWTSWNPNPGLIFWNKIFTAFTCLFLIAYKSASPILTRIHEPPSLKNFLNLLSRSVYPWSWLHYRATAPSKPNSQFLMQQPGHFSRFDLYNLNQGCNTIVQQLRFLATLPNLHSHMPKRSMLEIHRLLTDKMTVLSYLMYLPRNIWLLGLIKPVQSVVNAVVWHYFLHSNQLNDFN